MGEGTLLFYVLLVFVLLPLFFWYRVRYVKRRIDNVKSKCTSCGHIQRLAQVEDYDCRKCGYRIVYLDENGERRKDKIYICDGCGAEVVRGNSHLHILWLGGISGLEEIPPKLFVIKPC